MGRFYAADPENIGAEETDAQSWNAYLYSRNSPLVLSDPSGQKWLQSRSNPNSFLYVTDRQYLDNQEYYDENYRNADGARITLTSVPEGSPYEKLIGTEVYLEANAFTPIIKRCGHCTDGPIRDASEDILLVLDTFRIISLWRNAANAAAGSSLKGAASRSAASGAQVLVNRAAGKAAEKVVAQQLLSEGNTILGSQVSVRTSKGLRMIDHLIRTPSGEIIAIEVKSGGGVRNASQLAKDALIATEGATIVGRNAPAGLQGARVTIKTIERRVP